MKLLNGKLLFGQQSNNNNINEMVETELVEELGVTTIKKIACGYFHVLILTENKDLYGCGQNSKGQLGFNYVSYIVQFTKINISHLDGEIKEINCGGYYSTLLTQENGFYLTGQGACGQLGFGNFNMLYEFTKNNFNFGKIKSVKCCGGTTIILNEEGKFYFSGASLGNGENTTYNFEQLYCNPDIIDFCCGGKHVIMLDKFGNLYRATAKSAFKITIPPFIGNIKQIACSYNHYFILTNKNELYTYENGVNESSLVSFKNYSTKKKGSNADSYKNIKRDIEICKLYSGLNTKLYFTANNGERLYTVNENKEVTELIFHDNCKEKERYLFPFIGYDFAYIINSNNPNWYGESKEIERMIQLLFNQQRQNCDEVNNSFRDISFMF